MHSPLKRHGGKYYQAPGIVELMPPHLHYVEPFCGAAWVFFARPRKDWLEGHPDYVGGSHQRGCSEVINDLDGNLIAFWDVLSDRDKFEDFQRRLVMTPFAEAQFARSEDLQSSDTVEKAVAFFVLARQSRQALGRNFATLSQRRTRGGINEQANAWLSAVDALPDIHHRLRGVVILNQAALTVIKGQDGPYTLFYCDPPYLHETRATTDAYKHEMTEQQHRELLETLSEIEGKFMLSGYHSELYDDWAARNGYRCEERVIDNKASRAKTKERMVECLWMNWSEPHANDPTAATRLRGQQSLFEHD